MYGSLLWPLSTLIAERGDGCPGMSSPQISPSQGRDLSELEDMSVNKFVQLYNEQMTELLDKHCLLVQVRCKSQQMTSWFHADCWAARRHDDTGSCRKTFQTHTF